MPKITPIDREKLPQVFKAPRKPKPPKIKRPNHKTMNREVTQEEIDLLAKLSHLQPTYNRIRNEIFEIQNRLKELHQTASYGKQPVSLYALRLQNDCWYIGMTFNVEKRFKKHANGKGANWTKLYQPIEIAEQRTTNVYIQETAAALEDAMTLEYAKKYGFDKVRGGSWCQTKPHWPKELMI